LKTNDIQHRAQLGSARLHRRGQCLLAIFALLGVGLGGLIGHCTFGRLGVGFIIGSAAGILTGVSVRALVRK